MAKNYDITDEGISTVNEPIATYPANTQHRTTMATPSHQARTIQRMRDYCREHFDEAFVAEMEANDFLINVPQPSNESEFEDINQMFIDAEESGMCTDEEVRMMFAV